MDLVFFLKQRTSFVRKFFQEGRKPFDEIIHLIEEELHPYEPLPFIPDYHDTEPPFLEEWMEARMAVNILGLSCISMLSDTLKIYLKSLEREYGFKPTKEIIDKVFKTNGFLNGYKQILSDVLDTDWTDCPVEFEILEQIVLARNRAQHGGDMTRFEVSHDAKFLQKHPRPFFVSEEEKDIVYEIEKDGNSLFAPNIEVSQVDLFKAIEEVEKLATWIASRKKFAWEWRRRN